MTQASEQVSLGDLQLAPFKVTGHLGTDVLVMISRLEAAQVDMLIGRAVDVTSVGRELSLLAPGLSAAGYRLPHLPGWLNDAGALVTGALIFLLNIMPDVLGWNAEALAMQAGMVN